MLNTDYIEELVESYGDTVLRIAYTYFKSMSDAEDAVQDVFLHIIGKTPEFKDKEYEKAWIIRVTINICKNKLKLFWNRNKCSIDEIAEAPVYDKYNTDSEVLKAVMSLPDKYRIAVYMYYYEGYTTPEIARITDRTETAVRSDLHRARGKLKEILKEEYDFE